jgi:hypothetical protein
VSNPTEALDRLLTTCHVSPTINLASMCLPARKNCIDGICSFVITKLIGYPAMYHTTCTAILQAYPPVATTHHGVNFAKIALTEGGRASIVKYVDAICSQEDG